MITVVILDAVNDSAIEFSDKSIPLILQDMFESLLYHLTSASSQESDENAHPTTIHLHRESEHIPLHLFSNISLLGLITNFKQLLNDIIPKDIHHQRKQVWSDFSQGDIDFVIKT